MDTGVAGTRLYLCHSCGALSKVGLDNSLTNRAVNYCPFCGQPGLTQVKSSFIGFSAKCFDAFNPSLIGFLWQDWLASDRPGDDFVAYISHRLSDG